MSTQLQIRPVVPSDAQLWRSLRCQLWPEANEEVPWSWHDYNLIVSLSMLEYLPQQQLISELSGLRSRLAASGKILVIITRKTPETYLLVERLYVDNLKSQ
jgi:hypothetical protein